MLVPLVRAEVPAGNQLVSAFAISYSYRKWIAPRLPSKSAEIGSSVEAVAGITIADGIAVLLGWLPLFTLFATLGGATLAMIALHSVRSHPEAESRN